MENNEQLKLTYSQKIALEQVKNWYSELGKREIKIFKDGKSLKIWFNIILPKIHHMRYRNNAIGKYSWYRVTIGVCGGISITSDLYQIKNLF